LAAGARLFARGAFRLAPRIAALGLVVSGVAAAASYDQCMMALNATTAFAISLSGSATVNAPNCGVVVNSSSATGLSLSGHTALMASYINVVGGYSVTGNSTVTPTPTTNASPQPDPLTFLVPPTFGHCDYTNTKVTGNDSLTLSPGTYCNGISVSGHATVTFNAGTYVLLGGGLNVSGSSTLTGAGVTFFLTSGTGYSYGPLSVSGSAALNLSAPTSISSPYYGILFYQSSSIGSNQPASTMSGSSDSVLEGVFYFPTTGLTFSGSSQAGNYLFLIADTLRLTGSVDINGTVPNGRSPLEPPVSVSVSPGAVSLPSGLTQQFTATVNNSSQGVTWTLNPSSAGTISTSGLYTTPGNVSSSETVIITATSVEDPSKSATATVTVTPPITVLVTPPAMSLYASQAQQFTASSNGAVVWSINSTGVGSFTASGLYTAPANITGQQTLTVTATSLVDPSKSSSATITLLPPVAVSLSSPSASTYSGQTVQLAWSVINTNSTNVTWSLNPAGLGTVSATGLYTPPADIPNPQSVTITVTSQFDTTKSASVSIALLPLSVGVLPTTATLLVGQTQQFTAPVTDATNGAVAWTLNPATGTISATGLYTAPATLAAQQAVTVTATSQVDATKSANAAITLIPVSISVGPPTATLYAAQTQQFTANVSNAPIAGVNWTVNPQGAGTINGAGLYTAPALIANAQVVTITATSQADTSKSSSATVTLTPVAISVAPGTAQLIIGQKQQFNATVTNTNNTAVAWTVNPNLGTISTSGLYTAPASIASAQAVTITATSQADTTKTASATVNLAPVTVSVGPAAATLYVKQSQTFTATVGNALDSSVTWNISPTGAGAITSAGVYTAPASIASQQMVTVTAISNADPTRSGSATVTLMPVVVNVTPPTVTLYVGQSQTFTATVGNATDQSVTWSANPTGVGTLSATGVYTAPASIASQQTVTITAMSNADPSRSASATVTLVPVTITVAPTTTTTLFVGQSQAFTATVTNAVNQNVNWTISPTGVGSITTGGVYTAPASIASQQNVTITATSQVDSAKSASSTVVLVPVTVTVGPATTTLSASQTQQFSATVTNATDRSVTWSLNPTGTGTITSAGLYTAPATIFDNTTVIVTATSNADPSKSASGTLTLRISAISVTPQTVSLNISQTQQFTSTATNVTWTVTPAVGTISSSGLYTAPASIASQQTVTVTATSVADSTKMASATVTLNPVTVSVAPTSVTTLYVGQSQTFTATVTNTSNTGVTWSVNPAGAGTITTGGVYTAPATLSSQQIVTVTAASVADSTRTASATITLNPVNVSVAPTSVAQLYVGQSQTFTATVTNAGNTNVTWSITPAGTGTITTAGVYTAPATLANQQPVTITATSVADANRSATATVTLVPVQVSVAPSTATLYAGQTQQFTGTVTNATNTQVNWSVNPAGVGSVNTSGLYTAPASVSSQQNVSVVATSQADANRSASATVTLVPVTIISMTPQTATLTASQTQQFTATVQNATNTSVTWTLTPAVGAGTISSTGLYTAPDCINEQQTVTVVATSVADSTKTTSATITLQSSNTFSYQRTVVINHAQVPNTDQTNFPVVISVTDPALASASNGGHVVNPNGYDLVFTSDASCQAVLNYEIESWNPATGQLIAWVQVPLLSHTTDTVIQLCYGNSAITTNQSNQTGTWDPNYVGVWHFPNGTTLSVADSTHRNTAVNNGATAGAGQIDGAAAFNGSNQSIDASNFNLGSTSVTAEAWVKSSTLTSQNGLLLNKEPVNQDWNFLVESGNIRCRGASGNFQVSAPTPSNNAWHHLVCIVSGGTATIYVDGKQVATGGTAGLANTTNTLDIGRYSGSGGGYYFSGSMDEVRVSNVARSTDWINAEYNNQSSPGSFYTIYPENIKAISISPVVSYLYASQTQQFTVASFVGTCTAPVTWNVSPSGFGTISTAGLYTAPGAISQQQTLTVTAIDANNAAIAGTATITLEPPLSLTLSPQAPAVTASQPQQFTATVLNTPNAAVVWTIVPSALGTISTSGLYTAPSSIAAPQSLTVTATSVADPTKSASTTINLVTGSAFRYSRPIVIDHTKVPNTDQSNFAVLISGTYSFLASAANGGKVQSSSGYDIVFMGDCNGVTKLDHQIESYNPATGQIAVWVRIPIISHTTDTTFYMFYGDAAVVSSTENPTGVWDTNYQAVYHLNGATSLGADSTLNARAGTLVGGPTAAAGQIAGAASFNGSGQYIDIGNMGARPSQGTISMWVNSPTRVGYPNSVSTSALGNQCDQVRFEVRPDGSVVGILGNQYGDCVYNNVQPAFTTNFVPFVWHHLTLTWNQPQAAVTAYYDGNLAQSAVNHDYWPQNFDDVKIGVAVDLTHSWNGQIDEVRMSSVQRSADWIATEYNNQSSSATFYTIYPENGAISVAPQGAALYALQTQQMGVVGTCGTTAVTWSLLGPGSLSSAGLYTAPTNIATVQNVSITANTQSPAATASASLTLLPPAAVTVAPAAATLYNGDTQQFTASVSNAINTGVTWSVNPTGAGTINSTGLFSAPATISAQQNISVVATSVADSTKSATAVVTLIPGQGVSVSGGSFTYVLDLIAQAMCRKPHVAPVVEAGADQLTYISGTAAAATVTGTVDDYSLEPGGSLSYSWSFASGPATPTFATATAASTQVTFPAVGTYTLQFAVFDGLLTSVAVTHVTVAPAPVGNQDSIIITPPSNGPAAVRSPVTLQITLVGSLSGGSLPAMNVQVSGANPQSATLNPGTTGVYTFTYFGANPGTDTIVANATVCCFTAVTSNTALITWINAPPTLSSSPVTGQFFTNDGSGTFNTPKTQQPVFTETFPNINFNAAAGSVSNLTRPFTDVETDPNGNALGTIVAQSTNYQAGVGTMYTFSAVFTGSLNVPTAGPQTFTFASDDAYIFAVGNNATSGGGPQTNTPAASAFKGYPVMGGVNRRSAVAQSTMTVNFPAAGVYPYEVDYAKGGDQNLTLSMLGGNGFPIPSAALLTLSPATVPSITQGQIQTLALQASDPDGVALANQAVSVSINGINPQTRTLTTDGTGQGSFSYAGTPSLAGVDQVQATATVNGAVYYSNIVAVTWNTGVNQPPVVSAGSAQSVTLPAKAILNGSVSDDGLPNNTLTITWSVQSGPGTVTFDAPNQAVTGAAFSAPGTYTLQLSASDGALTTSATVQIVANGNAQTSSGWIANPINNAAVSGQVPVTLVSGITLTGGTLVYFPAGHPELSVTLNPSTTGTGQVGTFDATLLNNGGYYIVLNGTNSAAVTQSNQVYVTAVGDYKPGRVTATITDLTVPAPGLAIQIQRTYDSLVRGTSGDFGYGWNLGINVQMTVTAGGDVSFVLNGQRRTFYFTPQPNAIFTSYYAPVYTAEPGLYGSLVNTGDNCNGVLLNVANIYQCAIKNAGQVYAASGFRYVDPYGRIYLMSGTGTIQSIQDLSGNTLTVTATGISSTNGLSVPFVRDSSGRITKITDPLGNQYNYAYDVNGNLASVTCPPVTPPMQPTQYGYDPAHLLTSETDGNGHPAGSSLYYPDGKLQQVTDTVGNVTKFVYDVPNDKTTVTNPDGGTVVTVTDAYGMPLSVTDALNRVTKYSYDGNHNRISMTDPLDATDPGNHTTTYAFDANGFRTSLKDPLGNTWSTVYNIVGGPTSVTNPNGSAETRNLAYDTNFRISSITDGLGTFAQVTYNAAGSPLTVIDARNNTFSYQYDQNGNRTKYADQLTRTTHYQYDTLGNLISRTDPRGNATTYVYDAFNRRTSMTDAYNKTTTYGYDGNGNKTSETNRRGYTTAYKYDNSNRLIEQDYPDNTKRTYTYDWRNNKLTETDQLGRVTGYVYDLAGQLTSMTVASGTADAATTQYGYDLAGRKTSQTDPRNNTTYFTYDAAGRMSSMKDAVGNVTQYGYDGKGQRTSMLDAKNRRTTYGYDIRGRQATVTTPDGKTVTKGYDPMGLVTSSQDEENRTTQYVYDAASQLKTVIDALNQSTSYSYDIAGNELTQADANNHTTSYAWDNLNRRTSRTLPAGQIESFTYDPEGDMATRTDFNGKTTTYAYDPLNRLLSRTPDASFTGAVPESFTYTATGQRLTMTDASGTTTYTYTNRDQIASKATPQGTLAYTYDPAGNVISVVSSNTGGTSVPYAWDQNNRLQSVTDIRTGGATNYSYDQTNQFSSIQYPNGVSYAYSYDNRDRTTGLNVNGPGGLLASYTQTFSFSGRKTNIFESSGRTENYGYDSIYRLLNENITGDPTAPDNWSLAYALDPVGNRVSLTSTLAVLQSQSFSYDADDRLTTDTYDNNGNTTASGGVNYAYDFQDRPISTSMGMQVMYDGDGNRVSETAGGVTTKFLVDTQTPTPYSQVTEELVNGAVTAQFTYGLMRISQNRLGAVSYYGYDAGASVRELLNSTGAVTDTYSYDAFANTVVQAGSTVNEFQYRGEQFDASLRKYYLRARYYNPLTGRFLSRDSRDGLLVDPRSLHTYSYANGDPVNGRDPTGHGDLIEYDVTTICGGTLYCGVRAKTVVVGLLILSLVAEALDQAFDINALPPLDHNPDENDPFEPPPTNPPIAGPPIAGAP